MNPANNGLRIQDILLSLSNVTDLMNPALNEHHKHVAYIAYRLATALGYDDKRIQNIALAALLHDIGAFSEQERLSLLGFEDNLYSKVNVHAEASYRLLRDFAPFTTAAVYVRFHHRHWQPDSSQEDLDLAIPIESHLIHLADRIAVLIRKDQNVLRQTHDIYQRIANCTGVFAPELVEAFHDIASREEFWLNILYEPIDETLCNQNELEPIQLNSEYFESLVDLFRRIIDFRSIFTSVHSCGVAAVAVAIANIAGFSDEDVRMIKYAGFLHDLGKIAIPSEILEKPSPLNPHELSIIRIHPYHTDRILRPLVFLDNIRIWAAQHHERLDGKGYPFHTRSNALSLGSRILTVADVFTALTENRPYRTGMHLVDALDVMRYMVSNGGMDPEVYGWVRNDAYDIDNIRVAAQKTSRSEYQKFIRNTK